MKKYSFLMLLSSVLFFTACTKNDNTDTTPIIPVVPVTPSTTVEVTGDIAVNTTWTADKIYLLKGFVYVTNGATLTIQAGTLVKGDKATKGTLVITRGAKIDATGTVEKPIVFTSAVAAGGRGSGDWGGIILLGKAPINPNGGVAIIEGGLVATNGGAADKYIQYGGTDVNDNSGTIKYARIEYAGIPFSPDNEINGLTMGGVGAGTTLDYIEVYRSGDDSYEWFGGTVTAKHLLSIGAVDDDFDTDFGFSGKIQFGLAQRAQVVADFSGSNGFESDNDATGSNNAPQTGATFSNMTIVGPMLAANLFPATGSPTTSNINANFQHAAQIRRNSAISIGNSILANYTEGLYFDDGTVVTAKATSANYIAGRSVIKGNIIYGCNVKGTQLKGQNLADIFTGTVSISAQLALDNTIDATKSIADVVNDALKYGSDFKASSNTTNFGTPDFTVKAGSVAAAGADFTNTKFADTFFEKVAYKGAFGTTNWASGWASFDPQNLPYTSPGAVK